MENDNQLIHDREDPVNKPHSQNWMYRLIMSSVSNKVRIYVEDKRVQITLWMISWNDCVLLVEQDDAPRNSEIFHATHSQAIHHLNDYGTSPHDPRWRKVE